MKKRYEIESAQDIENALRAKGQSWENGRGKQRIWETRDGRVSWQEGETFSEPKAALMSGVLKVFGILGVLAALFYWVAG